jgi:hypothetical protein
MNLITSLAAVMKIKPGIEAHIIEVIQREDILLSRLLSLNNYQTKAIAHIVVFNQEVDLVFEVETISEVVLLQQV